MVSEKLLKWANKKWCCIIVDFRAANRKFDWLEISIVYNKSDKRYIVYDSPNVETASNLIQSVGLENISQSYSVANQMKYDIGNATEKFLLYMQLVAWNYNGYSVAPVTNYTNNSIFVELPNEHDY